MNATISARIVFLMSQGMDIAEAINAVLGDGAYEKLASEVYDALLSEG